jgi:hypothetical protein
VDTAESNLPEFDYAKPRYSEKACKGCGEMFTPTGARQLTCSEDCRKVVAAQRRKMASGSDRIGDSEGARQRNAAGREQASIESAREQDALKRIGEMGERALDRAGQDPVCGERQFIERVKAVGGAKRASDWPGLRGALVDVAACCLSWAARIDHAEGEDPLPAVRGPVLADLPKGENGNGHRSVPERYADILLDAAGSDLDGETARTTIERLIGVGL